MIEKDLIRTEPPRNACWLKTQGDNVTQSINISNY